MSFQPLEQSQRSSPLDKFIRILALKALSSMPVRVLLPKLSWTVMKSTGRMDQCRNHFLPCIKSMSWSKTCSPIWCVDRQDQILLTASMAPLLSYTHDNLGPWQNASLRSITCSSGPHGYLFICGIHRPTHAAWDSLVGTFLVAVTKYFRIINSLVIRESWALSSLHLQLFWLLLSVQHIPQQTDISHRTEETIKLGI